MTAGGYGTAWPSDADRANVQATLNRAYAEGRLSQPDFETRAAQVAGAETQDQLSQLMANLGAPLPPPGVPGWGAPPPGAPGASGWGAPPPGAPGWGAPPPGAPGWGAPPPGYAPMPYPARPTNQLAIAALVCGCAQLFFSVLTGIPAVILGHIARRQIRETGENGDGMALAGLILGYVGIGLSVIFAVILILFIIAAVHDNNAINNCTNLNC
jgi:Domain of unknown function (DUF4190)/Domain of unknown function (DUF1707)